MRWKKEAIRDCQGMEKEGLQRTFVENDKWAGEQRAVSL